MSNPTFGFTGLETFWSCEDGCGHSANISTWTIDAARTYHRKTCVPYLWRILRESREALAQSDCRAGCGIDTVEGSPCVRHKTIESLDAILKL